MTWFTCLTFAGILSHANIIETWIQNIGSVWKRRRECQCEVRDGRKMDKFKLINAVTEERGKREMMIMESVATPRTLINLSPPIQP